MSALNQARTLLIKSKEDLVLLEEIVSIARISDHHFGFHAQQAVEKALKAWIWALGVRPEKVHDLEALVNTLTSICGTTIPELDILQDLGVFAVVYRYDIFDWEEPLDRGQVLRDVTALITHVERVIAAVQDVREE